MIFFIGRKITVGYNPFISLPPSIEKSRECIDNREEKIYDYRTKTRS